MFEINNIYNVDSYKAIKEIPDKSIDLIYTDIPYLIEGGGSGQSEFENKWKWYMSSVNQRDKEKYGHPTCKPLGLVKRHLKHACTNDMVVFDPFLGSGTTAVACKQLGINYLGFELDKEYYQTALNRLKERSLFDYM